MCGRYTDTKRKKAMLSSVGLEAELAFVPRYNIAPTQEASIVALGEDGRPEHKRARSRFLKSVLCLDFIQR